MAYTRTITSVILITFAISAAYYNANHSLRNGEQDSRRSPAATSLSVGESTPQPATDILVSIGKSFFLDTRLSASGRLSCATCHRPELAFQDGYERALAGTQVLKRNTPTLLTVPAYRSFFWDGRAATLPEQVAGPLFATNELNSNDGLLASAVAASPIATAEFEFRKYKTAKDFVIDSLVAYIMSLQTTDTKYWRMTESRDDFTEEETKGFELFNGRAGCSRCHIGRWLTDNLFWNTGLPIRRIVIQGTAFGNFELGQDYGRADVVSGGDDAHAFRTPSLINVTLTAPYMHDGTFRNLNEVIDYYDRGGDTQAGVLTPLNLSHGDKTAILAFLATLSDQRATKVLDKSPNKAVNPSGRPGGF